MTDHKKLILLRHATAETGFGSVDIERNLTPTGQAEAVAIGREILTCEGDWTPDLVLSSHATRAKQTLEGLKQGLNYRNSSEFRDNFYSCSPDEVLETAMDTSEKTKCLLLLGHNPTWSDLTASLCGESRSLAPANAVLFRCEASSWAEALAPASWVLCHFLTPPKKV